MESAEENRLAEVELSQTTREVTAIIETTNKEKPSVENRRALAALFENHPEVVQIAGNLSRRLRQSKIERLEPNHFVREAVTAAIDAMQGELGYKAAPMASKLLIDQVITCWLDLADVQSRHIAILSRAHAMKEGEYWDKRFTRAQTRYIRALEALARVNRLSRIVPIQVNIAAQGGQQINMAGTNTTGE